MALPLVLIIILFVVAGIIFLFGRSSENPAQRGTFIAFSALVILLTGALLMADGLELPIQETITKDGDVHTIGYETLVNTEGTAQWVLFNSVFWFGAVFLLLSIAYTISNVRMARADSRRDVLEW